jgi:hypothetical protein
MVLRNVREVVLFELSKGLEIKGCRMEAVARSVSEDYKRTAGT